jgi:hypothetical protein
LILGVSGCASVPNVPLCAELIPNEQGFCKNTIDAKEVIVDNKDSLLDGKTWVEIKTGSLLIPAKSWAEIKAYILKQCKKSKECSDHIGDWVVKLDHFEDHMGLD